MVLIIIPVPAYAVKTDEDTVSYHSYRNELFTLGVNPHLIKTKWMEFSIDPEGFIGMRTIYEKYKLLNDCH